jgi:3-hydroxyacyl-[acyl-carrier-protein] dehydratase
MIDRVAEINTESIECVKLLAYNEPYFSGHFPDDPILPGVLLIEACAQASLLLTIAMNETQGTEGARGLLVDVASFRVFRPSRPGHILRITARIEERFGPYMTTKISVRHEHANTRVANGRLTFHLQLPTPEPITAASV